MMLEGLRDEENIVAWERGVLRLPTQGTALAKAGWLEGAFQAKTTAAGTA